MRQQGDGNAGVHRVHNRGEVQAGEEPEPLTSSITGNSFHFLLFFFFLNLINLNKEFACNKKQISRTVDSFQWFSYSEV